MLKKIIVFAFFMLLIFTLNAQKGNNILCVNGEAAVLSQSGALGGGLNVKGLYGIGKYGQLSATIGFTVFNTNNSMNLKNSRVRFIPFFIGYRQNIKHFFVEPQAGIGELGGKTDMDGDYSRPSVAAIFGALGVGYHIKKLNFGLRFQSAHGIENTSAGIWHDKDFYYTGIFIEYTIKSKRKH